MVYKKENKIFSKNLKLQHAFFVKSQTKFCLNIIFAMEIVSMRSN